MLGKLRIGPKLLLAPGAVLLLLIVLSCGAYLAMVRQNHSLESIVQQRAVHIRGASELVAEAHQAHTEIYQLLTWIGASFSPARVDALARDIHQRHRGIGVRFAALARVTDAGGAERRYLDQAQAAHALYVKAVLDVIELSQADQSMSANAMSKAERAFEAMALRLAELLLLERELSEQAQRGAAAEFKAMAIAMPLVVLASIGLSLAITVAVRRALLKEVGEIGDAAFDLASGKLTVKDRVYGRDEIADTSRALDTSIRNLNGTLRTILASARSIDNASREIARGNADLSKRTAAQADSLEQTASSVQELTATASKTASDALEANRLAASASSCALKGGDVVERLVSTMDTVKGSSRKVEEIAGVIDAIANQTNILALNAAVEAARAGEHGSGFAVVAAEVRTLAQQSALAARDIRDLIVRSVAEIEGGAASAEAAGSSMAELANSVQEVGEMIHQISDASAGQVSGIHDVGDAILRMDEMTHQNSARVKEAAAAAEALQRQALSLARAVATFRLDEGAQQLPPPASAPPIGTRPVPHVVRGHLRLASSR